MVTEIVTFKVRPSMTQEQVFAQYENTAPKWRANPDLIRKNYLFNPSKGIAGGVYLWKSRADAEKWHGVEFQEMIYEMWGVRLRVNFLRRRSSWTICQEK